MNNTIQQQAITELNKVSFIGDSEYSKLELDGQELKRSFWNDRFYADGPQTLYVDGDEYLNKTLVELKVKEQLSLEVKEHYNVRVYTEGQRGYFLVILYLK